MALQFNESAYGQAYNLGQQNEQTDRDRRLALLQSAMQSIGQGIQGYQEGEFKKTQVERDRQLYELQLAKAQKEGRELEMEDMPLNRLLSGNRLSEGVVPSSMMDQFQETGIGEASLPMNQQPGGNMIDRFRQFQQGKLRPPQVDMSSQALAQPDLSAFGLPPEAATLTPRQLKTMGEARKLFAAAGESDYYTPEQTQAVTTGDPTALSKAFGGRVPKSAIQQNYNIKAKEEALGLRQQQMDMKEQLRQEKEALQLGGLKSQADIVVNKVDQALKKVGSLSAGGMAGTANIPFIGQITGATDLAADIDTIKAILGFSQLTEMRKASPTGGALGQVSDRELKLLTSAVASLEQAQSPEQLKERLGEIKTRYQNWLSAVSGINPDTKTPDQSQISSIQPIVQRNKRTGQQRQSFDGGRTWQPL